MPLAEVQAGEITLRRDGTCKVDLPRTCGHFASVTRTVSDLCEWTLDDGQSGSVALTLGRQPKVLRVVGIHHLAGNPPTLWQYVCDPDSAEYLEYARGATTRVEGAPANAPVQRQDAAP